MWKFFQADKDGTPVEVVSGISNKPTLVAESLKTLAAHWQSHAITTATTTTAVSVIPNESILLTDIVVILSKKVAASTIIVQFYDGTTTEILFTFDSTIDSFSFSHAFQGGLRGWKDHLHY